MKDPIEREDAIKCLDCSIYITGEENTDAVVKYIKDVVARIRALPSATRPEVPKTKPAATKPRTKTTPKRGVKT